jgi:hypothetical protein
MRHGRLLKALELAIIVLAAARSSFALPQYVYCCAYGCDLVLLTDCPDGGWTSAEVFNSHCAAP